MAKVDCLFHSRICRNGRNIVARLPGSSLRDPVFRRFCCSLPAARYSHWPVGWKSKFVAGMTVLRRAPRHADYIQCRSARSFSSTNSSRLNPISNSKANKKYDSRYLHSMRTLRLDFEIPQSIHRWTSRFTMKTKL